MSFWFPPVPERELPGVLIQVCDGCAPHHFIGTIPCEMDRHQHVIYGHCPAAARVMPTVVLEIPGEAVDG